MRKAVELRRADPSAIPSGVRERRRGRLAPLAVHAWAASRIWTDATREKHYDNLCAIDGRIVLAGEHASYLPAWQEGAVLSSLDAIGRLHQRAVAGGHA